MRQHKRLQIGLIGNPNCGKTTLFNALTGARQRVGNWPGVTVERKSGKYKEAGFDIEVIDLPGTYSLETADQDVSIDEMITRRYIEEREADLIVNIIDASNLERNLYLTTQLADMGTPLLVALNMLDAAKAKGMTIDIERLERELGCPVVPIIASKNDGITALKTAIVKASQLERQPTLCATYEQHVEASIQAIQRSLTIHEPALCATRWQAIRILQDSIAATGTGKSASFELARELASKIGDDLDWILADGRYEIANQICNATIKTQGQIPKDTTDRIDRLVLNRVLGIPIFLLIMYLMFVFTIQIGGAFVDFFDMTAAALFVDGFGHLLLTLGSPEWLNVILAGGIGSGLQTVATFIPIIGSLYLFLSILEDSGYMARAAFVMDRLMRSVGLPGKSFVPLIVGFGCNVPAIMATRTLENRRDRLLTIAMTPFMSCGARLPVYALFAAAFFPNNAQNVVFALYVIGITAAVMTGLALKTSLLQAQTTPFIMELPPYHLPQLKGVMIHTWARLKGFVVRAGRIVVPMVLILNFLAALGADGSFGHENSESSVLAKVGQTISPVFSPFGLNADNWPAAVGIFTGILAKEAVVGTLNATYENLAKNSLPEPVQVQAPQTSFNLNSALVEAASTIPVNLRQALQIQDDHVITQDVQGPGTATTSENRHGSNSPFGAMVQRFDGPAGAFAYLLFILLYFPCTAATAAVCQEGGARWMWFVVLWTTGLGYGLATICYQAATFERDPITATSWIVGVSLFVIAAIATMRHFGSTTHRTDPLLPQAQ